MGSKYHALFLVENFRCRVVNRAAEAIGTLFLGRHFNMREPKVGDFAAVAGHENIGGFQISVDNCSRMKPAGPAGNISHQSKTLFDPERCFLLFFTPEKVFESAIFHIFSENQIRAAQFRYAEILDDVRVTQCSHDLDFINQVLIHRVKTCYILQRNISSLALRLFKKLYLGCLLARSLNHF